MGMRKSASRFFSQDSDSSRCELDQDRKPLRFFTALKLSLFACPRSCRQSLARFRTLPTALHRDHIHGLALGTPVPTRRAAARAFEAWGVSPFSQTSLLLQPPVSDCRFPLAESEAAYRSDLSFWCSRDPRAAVSTRAVFPQTAVPSK